MLPRTQPILKSIHLWRIVHSKASPAINMLRKLGKVTTDAAPLLELDEAAPVAVALWSPLDVFVACADSLSAEAVTPVLLKHS